MSETPRDCEHGQLARSCAICELQRELAERQITRIQDERAASLGRLNDAVGGTGMTAHQPEIDLLIEAAIKGIIKQKELAERQVAVLIKHAATYSSCFGCTARDTHRTCQHSDATCHERFAAWSRAEANKQVTNA